MRLLFQLPLIIGLCGLLWLSAELNASWLDHQLFPATHQKQHASLAQSIADRLSAVRQEFRDSSGGAQEAVSVSVSQ
jgi:hypothetical protein